MSDQLSMFGPMISEDTPSATSSLESESGVTPCVSQDGPTTAKSGPGRAPASPSARPAKAKRSTTKGIFGQSSFASSRHEDLSFALGNKLRPLTDSLGSTLFSLTWMTRITPAGRSISALRASEPLTEGSVFIGWPTPTTEDHKSDGPKSKARVDTGDWKTCDQRLRNLALLAGWPTTRATDGENNSRTTEGSAREMARKGGPQDLMQAVSLTAWGTPAARDWKSGAASQGTLDKNARPLNELALLAGWMTPKKADGEQGSETMMRGNLTLLGEARLTSWATPKVASGDYQYSGLDKILNLQGQVQLTAFGDGPIGYLLGPNGWEIVPASGQLNASHSRWLMGLPAIWDVAGIAAFRSLKKRKRGSVGSADTETA